MITKPQQRLQALKNHLKPDDKAKGGSSTSSVEIVNQKDGQKFQIEAKDDVNSFHLIKSSADRNVLTVLDHRTQKIYNIKIDDTNNTLNANDLKKIKAKDGETGLMVYDPGFINTAVARSKITFIDGDKGILHYRGYPIEELAAHSNFLEVTYLLIYGDLPTQEQFNLFKHEIMHHTFLHTGMSELMQAFNYDAHPMGMFISGVSAMSTFTPDANPALQGTDLYQNKAEMDKQIVRILGKIPTLAALSYRNRIGRPHNYPQNHLSYCENFLYMLDRLSEHSYTPNPKLAKALDADHELNCSTAAMRHIGSSKVDPYSAVAGAAAALYGPLHGGANEAVLRMLESIGSVDKVGEFVEAVKRKERKLMGFGHRIYKNYDPRAEIIRKTAYEVFEVCGKEPLIDVAVALEAHARKDPYFIDRQLYPNVDFYSGLIYKAMGFPTDFFPVLFAIPRVAGWLAHWKEATHENGKIWRPRQVYVGNGKRAFLPMQMRNQANTNAETVTKLSKNQTSKRSAVATAKY